MRVGDFEVEWTSGVFNCCNDHIIEHANDEASIGMIITCEYCDLEMVLKKTTDGSVKWCSNR